RPALLFAADRAPHSRLAIVGARLRPPLLHWYQAGFHEVGAVEEWCHLRAAAPRELLLDPAVPGIVDALDRLPVEEVYGAMGDGEVAARGYGVEQAGHDRVRVVGVRDRVQDR